MHQDLKGSNDGSYSGHNEISDDDNGSQSSNRTRVMYPSISDDEYVTPPPVRSPSHDSQRSTDGSH